MSHSSQISMDFHLFEAKLTAELYTFGSPGAFATVELIAEGEGQGPRLKLSIDRAPSAIRSPAEPDGMSVSSRSQAARIRSSHVARRSRPFTDRLNVWL